MKKIIVRTNEEYKVRIINEPNSEEVVYDAYVQARNELKSIINDTKKYYDEKGNVKSSQVDFSNNIIAFSGERGQGKSSAMLSFSNFLKNKSREKVKTFLGENICNNNFNVIERIDPTKFESGDNIITIIIARIFRDFCNYWDVSEKNQIALRSELLEQFQLCSKEIDTIKSKKINDSDLYRNEIDMLSRIGDSANLKEELRLLIEKYFRFVCGVKGEAYSEGRNYLVIQLDDTDLNTKRAYDIVEDVRKYYMLPNVVIFMAVDLDLLTYSIEQSYIEQFLIYNEHGNGQKNRFDEFHQLAVKYIDKLIPGSRKIFLPYIKPADNEYGEQTVLEYLDSSDNMKNILSFRNNSSLAIADVQEIILRFIYEKTGLVFIKPSTYRHNIVPATMRELVNFLSILNNMDSIKNDYDSEEDLTKRLQNLSIFETYFVKTWIPNHVDEEYIPATLSFLDVSWTAKNKQIIKEIGRRFSPLAEHSGKTAEDTQNLVAKAVEEVEIKAAKNLYIYSLADVRKVLYAMEDMMPEQKTYSFTFAIKTLYSIFISRIVCNDQLYRLKIEKYKEQEVISDNNKDREKEYSSSLLSFLGGDIFGEDVDDQMRKDGDYKIVRSDFRVSFANQQNAYLEMRNSMRSRSQYWLYVAAFCNFEFPNAQEPLPPYDVPYRAANFAISSQLNFNVSFPIMYLIDEKKLFERAYEGRNKNRLTKTSVTLFSSQKACMQIVSSMDMIHFLNKHLKRTYALRTNGWDFSDHVINYYNRINEFIKGVNYLPLNPFNSGLIESFEENREFFNGLYRIYYNSMKASLDIRNLEDEIKNLSLYKNTKTVESLISKANGLYDKLSLMYKNYRQRFVYNSMEEVRDFINRINNSNITNLDEIKSYQGELNRIISNLKNTYKE